MTNILTRPVFTLSPKQLAGLHSILQLLDCITTTFIVTHIGADAELNPVMRHLCEHGVLLFILVKVVLGVVALPLCMVHCMAKRPNSAWIWRWLSIAYFAVVLNNLASVACVCITS